MSCLFALMAAWLASRQRGAGTEFDVFTKAMLVFSTLLGIASATAVYGDASVTRALAACEIAHEPLRDCMESKGYVLSEGDPSGASDSWQSEWAATLFGDW